MKDRVFILNDNLDKLKFWNCIIYILVYNLQLNNV
jgi:hypothetical protein